MITTDLTGNIGDHITRYLLCRTVAERNNYEWSINKKTSHDYYNGTEQMNFLDIDYGLPNNTPYGRRPEGVINIWEEKVEHHGTYDYVPYQPDVFDVPDNTKLVIKCAHDANYYDKDKVTKWLKIKDDSVEEYNRILLSNNINLEDENLCILNCRGGEYRGVPSLFLEENYWKNAVDNMSLRNPKMKFMVVTEDPEYFKKVFDFPVMHISIGCDYYIVNNAKNLIISNSAFGIFSSWTNQNNPYVIAPKYWARHNVSDGYYANSDMESFGWNFMDRNGALDKIEY